MTPRPRSKASAARMSVPPAKAKPAKKSATNKTAAKPAPSQATPLSGGNPQIAKGYGDESVQAYIAAMPGWKRDVGRRLDALIAKTVPDVRKAVKWNTPLYGVEDNIWFMSFHCFTRYVKVAFFKGAALKPMPPGTSTQKNVRYLDIFENDAIDEAQITKWIKQASKIPGEKM